MESGLVIRGLKCDAPSCGYRDDSIEMSEYESYIDAPCPLCGASLLTREDFELVDVVIQLTSEIEQMVKESEERFPAGDEDSKSLLKVNFSMNGTGKLGVGAIISPVTDSE